MSAGDVGWVERLLALHCMKPDVGVHTCNPSTGKTEAEETEV